MNAITETKEAPRSAVFSRVLVGVDGSNESTEAARQAAIIVEGELTLLVAYDVPTYADERLHHDAASTALERAREKAASASPAGKIVRGRPAAALIAEIEREEDTLLVVGSHGTGRIAGFLTSSTATEVIHRAPCSVLVARSNRESADFPRKIVVGVDGSAESAEAFSVACQLAGRFNAELRPVVASGGKIINHAMVDAIVGRTREELPDEPVAALLVAAADADLLIVGSRGLRGLKAVGSVSERLAHQARSSVLIVHKSGLAESRRGPHE